MYMRTTYHLILLLLFVVLCIGKKLVQHWISFEIRWCLCGKKLVQHWISFEIRWCLWGRGGFNGLFLVTLVVVAAMGTVAAAAAAAATAIVAHFLAAFIVLAAGGASDVFFFCTTFSFLVWWFCWQGYLSFVVGHVWVIQGEGNLFGTFVNDESIVGHAGLFFGVK